MSSKELQLNNSGMALVEMLVALAIFAVVIIAIGAMQADIFKYKNVVSGNYQTAQNSQVILKTMLKELREAAPGANGAFPIAVAGSTTLAFYSDSNNDNKTELITYSLIGTTLYRAVINPSGSPPVYLSANQSTSTLITNVINGNSLPSFEYFDTNYAGTSTPLTHPINPSVIKLIRVNQRIDLDPNIAPVPIVYTIQASIRNLKSNL